MSILSELKSHSSPEKSKSSSRFFKTGKGEYGEGDVFLGVTVPEQRKIASKYVDISLNEIKKLLESEIHEVRFTAFEILVMKYEKSNDVEKEVIYKFYLSVIVRANNWDLVDTSAPYIVGQHLLSRDKKILERLAKSDNIWERRISIVSTLRFIQNNYFETTLEITKLLINDNEDLIHKACGWMLREVGKRDKKSLDKFLIENYKNMPRTMLRYAIEKHNEEERKKYLLGNI